ncbi:MULTISPECIES: chemotaxis protein CheB [Thiorhodovibrio]|uniref:chemotaxis protein CheB n=1 Tax=Thiorhodovibrio TaxID=61593 RepID=UPI0019137887|nr:MULTISPECIES: chemotaxis protein CheB [Thiorhodovibrio]MBK5969962.1 chemotaxis protein CheR [Thiorhodovibrio winogradskyi]WPL12885.1 Chemotaxis protein methyltransferase [Thiorhodovibrio litoralis]
MHSAPNSPKDTPTDASPTPLLSADNASSATETPPPAPEDASPPPDSAPAPFPIVGIGASAGGLAAFEAFFSAIPPDTATGMAFVLVQHLAPDHKSILTDLVKRYTCMQVQEVTDGMVVAPDCAYIIPPKLDMALFNGKLHLLEPSTPRGQRLPIDFFFRSLADDQHERAICVVLSGTGSDGTLGARAIKGAGGLVVAQSPDTAAYDGMPRSIIANSLADLVLSPAEMPERLMTYLGQAFAQPADVKDPLIKAEDSLTKICLLLRDATRHDFSQYKRSTLVRRIERRMALQQIERQSDYVRHLQREPGEILALFHDLLIGVTNFFRDPEAFAVLETEVIPKLFARKAQHSTVRIWVCGCSSGEEAYSIAILAYEHMEAMNLKHELQIFATDVDVRAIAQARAGSFPTNIAVDISPERLERFFTLDPENQVYRIQKVIRDLLVFSEQDLIRDPPFSRIDLISCRNLLIYLDGNLQRRIIPLFHYALSPNGVLFLGSSETIGDNMMMFTALDRKWKIFARLDPIGGMPAPTIGELTLKRYEEPKMETLTSGAQGTLAAASDLHALTVRTLLEHFNAVGVLIDAKGTVCYIHGRTGRYLEPAVGSANMDIFQMARDGLRRPLTAALQRAISRQEVIQAPNIRVKTNGDFARVNLSIRPIKPVARGGSGDDPGSYYLVVFEPAANASSDDAGAKPAPDSATGATPKTKPSTDSEGPEPAPSYEQAIRRIAELEDELHANEDYLQTTREEMETSNEELKSTNEEMQSVNEELQSTNEELETSKEELQSVNEELATVNTELQTKVVDLSRANDDMNNLLAGTGVATLFVDDRRCISRFTPAMTKIIKLIPGDTGRPVGDIVSNLIGYTTLEEDVDSVLQTLVPIEKSVQALDNTWYLMRIGPYRTLTNVIEGAVMTFVDITSRKRMEDDLHNARTFAEGIVEAVREPLIILDGETVLISANRAFYRHFQLTETETLGQALFELGKGQWDIPALRELIEKIQDSSASIDDYRIEHDFPRLGRRVMQINARRLSAMSDQKGHILLAFEDMNVPVEPDTAPPAGGPLEPNNK